MCSTMVAKEMGAMVTMAVMSIPTSRFLLKMDRPHSFQMMGRPIHLASLTFWTSTARSSGTKIMAAT